MESRLKTCANIMGFTFVLCAFAGSAMAGGFNLGELLKLLPPPQAQQPGQQRVQQQEQQPSALAMAEQPEEGQSKPVQMIVPSDKRVAAAIEEALPTIKKILTIHQCVKDDESIRQMNFYAVPGTDMAKLYGYGWGFPNSTKYMNYHDRNKCVSVSTIDQWTMPALNALLFRVVYFADDSGETTNFLYLFKKTDDGSWKIAKFERGS